MVLERLAPRNKRRCAPQAFARDYAKFLSSERMEPVDPLGAVLHHAGHQYELWLRRDEWHLYRGQANGTSFRFFIIIKADRKPGPNGIEPSYWLKKAPEDVNVCGPFFANVWVARDKFLKLTRGQTRSITHRAQNRHQYQDRKVQVDLPALQRLSLADVFRVLEGRSD
jgi:hypothetical protein